MPVKKPALPQKTEHMHHVNMGEFGRKLLFTLVAIFLVYLIFLLGTEIRNNLREYYYIGHADRAERTISFEATGRATVKPDVATTNIGMTAVGETVAAAQEENTAVMNGLIDALKGLGVSADDIQTANYNVYPQYNYTEDGRELEGYTVSQSVEVKIRDLEKANQVIALAGEYGANSVSGLQFTIDDTDVYVAQARDEALEKLYKKASELSKMLGVRLVSVVSYDEYTGGDVQPYASRVYAEDAAYGGASAPKIEAGSADVEVTTRVTFEIR